MRKNVSVQVEVNDLNVEYEAYVRRLRVAWLRENRFDSKDVYEVMHPTEREKVHECIAQWKRYITPFAEAWWEERGYGVVWPEDDSNPMQVYKLKAAKPSR